MAEQTPLEQAMETGRLGAEPLIERDAFTLQGQGADTAQREREAHEELRTKHLADSRDPDYGKGKRSSSSKKSTSSSSSSGSSSTS